MLRKLGLRRSADAPRRAPHREVETVAGAGVRYPAGAAVARRKPDMKPAVYFALRQRSTGGFLPEAGTLRRGVDLEPGHEEPPRLFFARENAQRALTVWLNHDPRRDKEDMEVVAMVAVPMAHLKHAVDDLEHGREDEALALLLRYCPE